MSDPEQTGSDFEKKAKALLDARGLQLAPTIVHDLQRARRKALDKLEKPRPSWQPAILVGAVALTVLVIIGLQTARVKPPASPGAMEDMTILSSSDNLDLYENLDFYQWLDEEKHNS